MNKESNFALAFGKGIENLHYTLLIAKALLAFPSDKGAKAASLAFKIRENEFFYPAATLGFFLFAPFALLLGVFEKRFRNPAWRLAMLFWIFIFAAMTLWCLPMFGPHTISIHQGSYALVLMMLTAGVLTYCSISKILAIVVTAAQPLVGFLLNEVLLRFPYTGGALPEGLIHRDTLLLMVVAVTGVACLSRAMANEAASSAIPLDEAVDPRSVCL